MGVNHDNLQVTIAKAENSQAFQNQQLLLDRALQAQAAESQIAKARASTEQVVNSQETENPTVDPEESGRGPRRRARKRRKRVAEEPRRRPPSPNGEGSLIDIIV